MTTSSVASGKLSLRKRRREKLVVAKSHEDGQHKCAMTGKTCRRIPIPSFTPLDDQPMTSLQDTENIRTLDDERCDNVQIAAKVGNTAFLCDDLLSLSKANVAKNAFLNNNSIAGEGNKALNLGESGALYDLEESGIIDDADSKKEHGCQSSEKNTVHSPLQTALGDAFKQSACHQGTIEGKSDDNISIMEPPQFITKSDAAIDNNLNFCSRMTDETKFKENNQKQLDPSVTNNSDQDETTHKVENNKQKPVSDYFLKSAKNSIIDLVDSPSIRDFDVPRPKYLADKEAALVKKHAYNLEKLKSNASKKKTNSGMCKKGASRNSSQRKQCTLCLTCSCSRGSALQSLEDGAISENQNPLLGLARSDAEIERALIGRLARLEKSASWFDNLCSKVDRELKRHRNKIKAKIKENNQGNKPKFLSDADDVDERRLFSGALPNSVVNKAKMKTFSFRKKAQPTLTQMLASSDESDDGGEEMDQDTTIEVIDVDEKEDPICNEHQDEKIMDIRKDYTEARSRGKVGWLWNASREKRQNIENFNTFDESAFMYEKNIELDSKSEDYSIRALDYGEDGLSELLDVFDVCDSDHEMMLEMNRKLCLPSEGSVLHESMNQVTYSQLSPISKTTYKTLKSRVDASPDKVAILNSVCSDWEENIRFALGQNPTDVRDALTSVRKKREFLSKAMDMLQKQSVVLDIYEMALNESLQRHGNQDDCDGIGVMDYQS
mmetsp:Transcript_9665/g.18141  ORF Transcript_9665/g.18141 Transcript_9665/m.18141 type:complete len:722 (-) Transcript_9665:517-2682(-)